MKIKHPDYYANKQIEVIDYIKDTLTEEEYIGFCIGNVIKYISRWRKKGGVNDLKKALYYLNNAVKISKTDKHLRTLKIYNMLKGLKITKENGYWKIKC